MKEKASVTLIRSINSSIVLNYLLNNPDAAISDISKASGLSLPTVTRTINKALKIGLVISTILRGEEKGRKAQCYAFNEDYCKSLLIHIKETRLLIEVVTLSGKIINKEQFPITQENILNDFHSIIKAQMAAFDNIKNICVTFPGHISCGFVYNSHAFPQFTGLNLKQLLEETYGVTACVMDSVKVLVFAGQLYVPDYNAKSVLFLSFETEDGYGSAVSVRGVTFPGRTGGFGELYRIPVDKQKKKLTPQKLYTALTQSMIAVVNPNAVVFYGNSSIDFDKIMEVISQEFWEYAVPEVYFGKGIIHDNFEAMKHIAFDCVMESIEPEKANSDPINTWFKK